MEALLSFLPDGFWPQVYDLLAFLPYGFLLVGNAWVVSYLVNAGVRWLKGGS